jgi:hypothetical protein
MDSKSNNANVCTNIIVVILFFTIVIVIYNLFIKNSKIEPFENKKKKDKFVNVENKMKKIPKQKNTVYEKALTKLYGDNKRLICSMIPSINNASNICKIDNVPYIIYKFPIHIIKLIDDSILAVFNDGRMYKKYSMESTIWEGPILNSMPLGTIPLRMVTLGTDLTTLYGVGYDNILYVKKPTKKDIKDIKGNNYYGTLSGDNGSNNEMDIKSEWKQVPNNSGIIYVLFDNKTDFLISIDINGKLFTKTSSDIATNNQELVTLLDRPVLRLYYDLNGYMLVIDNKFDMYQFTDIDWKTTPLQLERGPNPKKIHDILYDNDGKLFGLIFNTDAYMVQIMKQSEVFYLSDFNPLDMILSKTGRGGVDTKNTKNKTNNFIMSYQDIIKAKIGSLKIYLINHLTEDSIDDDPNFAYQKQIIETKSKLVQFCNDRSANTNNTNYDNYQLLSDVEINDDKISKLKNVITSLMQYEPERMQIQDKYAILNA